MKHDKFQRIAQKNIPFLALLRTEQVSLLEHSQSSANLALSHYVDIHGQPRSNLLAELVQYSPAQSESRLMLEKLCGIHGQDPVKAKKLYQEWVLDARRTIYHILEDLNGNFSNLCNQEQTKSVQRSRYPLIIYWSCFLDSSLVTTPLHLRLNTIHHALPSALF